MHDLQLVGVHDDGEHLLLTGTDGQRYRLRIDESVRAAVRRDRARMGQLQIEMDGGVRPRDIQTRIRGGESAEDVAAAAGLPLEHVRRYEGPVLAERAHVGDLARRLGVRHGDRRLPFGELVVERLGGRGVDVDALTWDAWRCEGNTWAVQVTFHAGSRERRAAWHYDLSRSHLEPQDDEARWLSAVEDREDDGPVGSRRLAAVRERVYDVEADGGVRDARTARQPAGGGREDRAAAAGEPAAAPAAVDHEDDHGDDVAAASGDRAGTGGRRGERHRTLDLLDALRDRRGRRQPLALPDELTDDLADDLADGDLADGDLTGSDLGSDPADRNPAAQHPAEGDANPAEGLRTRAEPAGGARSGDPAADEPPAAHPAASRPEDATDAEVLELPDPPADHPVAEPAVAEPAVAEPAAAGASGDETHGAAALGSDPGATADSGDTIDAGRDREPATAGARPGGPGGTGGRARQGASGGSRSRGGSKRASVPSWDEIMFGAKRE